MIFIADVGSNFTDIGSLKEVALHSKKAGVTFFKPQLYDASKLYSPIDNPYYPHQLKCSLSIEQAEEIYDYCNSIGLECTFSVFDLGRLRWVADIGCEWVKIAASVAGNAELLSEASNYGFKAFISLSPEHKHFSIWEYRDLFHECRFMYCRSLYPAKISDYSLEQIRILEGCSDHTNSTELSYVATAVGANTIEKHVWFKYVDSPDIECSIHTSEMSKLIKTCNEIDMIRGK